jgi:hypothetical protein
MKFIQLFILLSFFTFTTISSTAQSAREIGVSTNGFNDLGFIYKKETKLNTFIRWKGVGLNLTGVDGRSAYNVGLTLGVAREKRQFINDKFAFIHGLSGDIRMASSFILNSNIFNFNAIPSIGYLFGIHYKILDDLYINLEMNPAFSVAIRADSLGVEVNSYSFRVNSKAIGINLMYRFR